MKKLQLEVKKSIGKIQVHSDFWREYDTYWQEAWRYGCLRNYIIIVIAYVPPSGKASH